VHFARAEPLGKPSPDEEAAMSWRVPGPGGHVRHFLVQCTIEDYLRDVKGPVEDSAELKRPWLYGFYVTPAISVVGSRRVCFAA
jgi:hypothetical protein